MWVWWRQLWKLDYNYWRVVVWTPDCFTCTDGTVHNLNEYMTMYAADTVKAIEPQLVNAVRSQKLGVLIGETQLEEFFSLLSWWLVQVYIKCQLVIYVSLLGYQNGRERGGISLNFFFYKKNKKNAISSNVWWVGFYPSGARLLVVTNYRSHAACFSLRFGSFSPDYMAFITVLFLILLALKKITHVRSSVLLIECIFHTLLRLISKKILFWFTLVWLKFFQ